MVLKLYGNPKSTCTTLVGLVCKEKEIPFELITIDLSKGEHKAPEYVKYQPFGQIPYIDDDGFILYESRAICRYLIKKYPSQGTRGLIPTDPKEEALFEQAASVEVSNYNPSASGLVYEKVFKKFRGLSADEARVEEHLKTLKAKLDAYDVILGKQKYVAGDKLTLADLQHLAYGNLVIYAGHGNVFEDRPNVARWWKDITSRPSWEAVKNGVQ